MSETCFECVHFHPGEDYEGKCCRESRGAEFISALAEPWPRMGHFDWCDAFESVEALPPAGAQDGGG